MMGHDSANIDASNERATVVRFVVLGWLCLAAAIAYVHRGVLAVPAPQIKSDLDLNDDQLSWIMSSFYLGYAIFQLPSGWLGDRWGPRLALTFFALTWSAATAFLGLTTGFVVLFACHFTNGIAQAGLFPAAIKSLSRWFPASRRAFPTGILASFMSIGGMLATALPALLLPYMSWQILIVCLAVPGVIWTVGFHYWFRDEPQDHPWVNDAELELIREGEAETPKTTAKPPTPWGVLLTSPQMLFISGQQFFRAAGYVFYATWFPTYLQETRGVSLSEAGFLAALPLLGVVLGATCGGAASDWIQRRTGSRRLSRQGWAIFNMVACALFILGAYFVEGAKEAVLLIGLGSFHAGMGGPAGYSITMDVGGKHVSTVFSLMNTAGNIGGAICPKIVAWLVIATGQWELVLLLFVAIYLSSAASWALVDPTTPIVKEDA